MTTPSCNNSCVSADRPALAAVGSKKGDVLLVAEGIGKSYDGEKELFSGLTFSVVYATKPASAVLNNSILYGQ